MRSDKTEWIFQLNAHFTAGRQWWLSVIYMCTWHCHVSTATNRNQGVLLTTIGTYSITKDKRWLAWMEILGTRSNVIFAARACAQHTHLPSRPQTRIHKRLDTKPAAQERLLSEKIGVVCPGGVIQCNRKTRNCDSVVITQIFSTYRKKENLRVNRWYSKALLWLMSIVLER